MFYLMNTSSFCHDVEKKQKHFITFQCVHLYNTHIAPLKPHYILRIDEITHHDVHIIKLQREWNRY